VLAIYFIIGDMLLILPSLTISAAKQDGWLSGLWSFAFWPVVWLLYRFSRLFPKLTIIQYNRLLLGKWVGGLVSVFYLYYFLTNTSILVREVGDFFLTQIFTETPGNAIHFMMIIALVWAVKSGLESVARTGETFLPLYVFLFLALFLLLLPKADFSRLQPLMGEGVLAITHGSLYGGTFTFCELNAFLMIFPYVVDNKHTQRDLLLGTILGGLAICSLILVTLLGLVPIWLLAIFMQPTRQRRKLTLGAFCSG
jgi:spore germination protein KB